MVLDSVTTGELAEWRAATPGCLHRVHMNNAGAGLMPDPLHRAITEHVTLEPQIGGYEAADARADVISGSYAALAELLGTSPRNIAITASATDAFDRAISSIDFRPGDTIITSYGD